MKLTIAILMLALVASNIAWYQRYHKLDQEEAQGAAMLQWSNDLLKGAGVDAESQVWKVTRQNNTYELGVTCANDGDPTVVGNFDGTLVVSCGGE